MSQPHFKRRRKLIKPRIQLRLIATFLGASALSLVLQVLLLAAHLVRTADALPTDGETLAVMIPDIVTAVLVTSIVVLLPTVGLVGVLATFRLAGPIYRFEIYLREVIEGRETGPCRLRAGDELQELCALLNEATEPARAAHEAERQAEREAERAERPVAA